MFWVWRCYGLLWTLHWHKGRYCDVTMILPLLFHGIRADVSETPSNALATRMHGDYRPTIDRFFVGFNAICYAFLRNNPIYIEGRNCSFSTVPVLFNKCSGRADLSALRPLTSLRTSAWPYRVTTQYSYFILGEKSWLGAVGYHQLYCDNRL